MKDKYSQIVSEVRIVKNKDIDMTCKYMKCLQMFSCFPFKDK